MAKMSQTTHARPGRPRSKNSIESTKTLDRGLLLLEKLGSDSLTLSEISSRTELHPSTASRLIRTLCSRGYVVYDEQQGLYQLGSRLSSLNGETSPQQQLIESARPLLQSLHEEFDETVSLTVREETSVVYLDNIQSTQPLRIFAEVGARAPLHPTAAGKALLMGQDEARITSIFQNNELEAFTEKTITDVESFIAEVRRCEDRGYAVNNEERQKGVICVAAPLVFDSLPLAAITVSGPRDRLPGERQLEIGKRLMELAAR